MSNDVAVDGGTVPGDIKKHYFIGVDGGATHCRASLFKSRGQLLSDGRGGPANPVNGLRQAQESILTAINNALTKYQSPAIHSKQLIIGAGLAGLCLPGMQQAMQDWQHPFHSLYLTTDSHIAALGAHQGQDGAIVILGTGFSALGLLKGQQHPLGGYGFPINATCSGSWFGLEAVKAALLDADGVGPATSMTQALLEHDTVIGLAEKMNNAPAQQFGRLAPLVFIHADQGDQLAIDLIQQGAAFIDRVIEKLLALGLSRVALLGGIAPRIQPWLAERLQAYIVQPEATPEQGAMYFARQSFAIDHAQQQVKGSYAESVDGDCLLRGDM